MTVAVAGDAKILKARLLLEVGFKQGREKLASPSAGRLDWEKPREITLKTTLRISGESLYYPTPRQTPPISH